ncbi:Cyclohexadienyl dehydrogenase [Streptomyces sp. V17-9]|nr:prephenate dehydrogenase [Streptomyces sp. SID10362]QUW93878.1 Cyclohexadienyl dehydrogenase [Streptomyces sp. V17-9]
MIRTAAVVGTGLIGTSIALALTRHGVTVYLADADVSAARTAAALGAGLVGGPPVPADIAVLAVPPARVGAVLAEQQRRRLARCYTDVASVKGGPEREVAAAGADAAVFIGGHPMAGRERSGPLAACATLFEERTWVLSPSAHTGRDTLNRALELVALCGAVPVLMDSEAHDRAVAVVSHAPHVVAALMAARLQHLSPDAVRLAGQGVRDVTRIADGDVRLWSDILESNATAVADVLEEVAGDLIGTVAALRALAGEDTGARAGGTARLADLLTRGLAGRGAIAGKHKTPDLTCVPVRIRIGDQPGELARLLGTASELGINIEDMSIDHTPDKPSGLVELMVSPTAALGMAQRLKDCGWRVQRVADHSGPRTPSRRTGPAARRDRTGARTAA